MRPHRAKLASGVRKVKWRYLIAFRITPTRGFLKNLIRLIRDSTTGMSALFVGESRTELTYKSLVYFSMFAMTIYMFWYASKDYWQYKVSTITHVTDLSMEGVSMPSITICNVAGFKRSIFCAAKNLNYTGELCNLEDKALFAGRFMNSYGEKGFRAIAESSVHTIKEQVSNCFFKGEPCDEKWFQQQFVSFPRYGQCFCVFCNKEYPRELGVIRGVPTIDAGLSLVLRNDREEQLNSTKTSGYLVIIHYPGTMPDANSNAVFLTEEATTAIGLTSRISHRLPAPYVTKCRKEFDAAIVDTFGAYSSQICLKVETALVFFDRCGIVPRAKVRSDYLDTDALCSMNEDAKKCCSTLSRDASFDSCTLPCHETVYSTTVSVGGWETAAPKNTSIAYSRVLIYFTSLSIEITTEVATVNFLQLVNLIGGYMGMFVGYSFLIFFETIEILLRAIVLGFFQ